MPYFKIVCVPFPFGVRVWNSIVSVPDYCLFINLPVKRTYFFFFFFFLSIVGSPLVATVFPLKHVRSTLEATCVHVKSRLLRSLCVSTDNCEVFGAVFLAYIKQYRLFKWRRFSVCILILCQKVSYFRVLTLKNLWNFHIHTCIFNVKEPRALSKLFGLQILLENQNVSTGWLTLKMFSWIIVV